VTFFAKNEPKERPVVTISDLKGTKLAEFKLTKTAGFQRDRWDFNYIPEFDGVKSISSNAAIYGVPLAPPGEYVLTVTVDGTTYEKKAVVLPDPRKGIDASVLNAQIEGISRASRQTSRLATMVSTVRNLRDRLLKVEAAGKAAGESASEAVREIAAFRAKLDPLAAEILPKDTLTLATRDQSLRGGAPYQILVGLSAGLAGSSEPPTAGQLRQLEEIERLIGAQVEKINLLIKTDVPKLNEALKKAGWTESLTAPAEIKD
jgi:hypothetical protein